MKILMTGDQCQPEITDENPGPFVAAVREYGRLGNVFLNRSSMQT